MSQLMSVVQSMDDGLHHKNIKMSRRLPSWMWYLLARSLGIKLNPEDKPIFATLLHIITLTAAVTFGITGAWYNVCDILSEYSKTTVLIGTVTMMIGFGWILLGVYAHKLAGKLFSNKNFAESVRMHSKTFLKISTAGLMSLLGLGLVGINSYDGFDLYLSSTCTKIQLQPIVCHIQYVSKTFYALLCVLWTLLVGFVMLSVCRTHTIGVRRFMREMTMDAKRYEAFWMEQVLGQVTPKQKEEQSVEEEWFIWDDLAMSSDVDNNVVTSQGVFLESIRGQTFSSLRSRGSRSRTRSEPVADNPNTLRENDVRSREGAYSEKDESEENKDESCDILAVPPIMSNDILLFSYWKMSRRLVVTSRFLQRWLSSWIAFIFIWCADYIIFWANHSATLTGILQFVFPLLVLLLVCSAYAEVNAEGQRLIKCICPTEGRLHLLKFFVQQPLQMQVGAQTTNLPITYNAILGVILAFSVAIASRIVLDEVL
ncbi:uncharacterized protein LOC124288960 isoform X2 [Haliotis rubra]|uniref:uncharacterized protein LOC124288960 isoform X2 n=1 Tax=Haliotis rubra TaxID=36100 RepID=UPI001EE55720|nr:uncharacterized protein LOC124288960 isoform X2 [Haliotis rubra]